MIRCDAYRDPYGNGWIAGISRNGSEIINDECYYGPFQTKREAIARAASLKAWELERTPGMPPPAYLRG